MGPHGCRTLPINAALAQLNVPRQEHQAKNFHHLRHTQGSSRVSETENPPQYSTNTTNNALHGRLGWYFTEPTHPPHDSRAKKYRVSIISCESDIH